MIKEKKLNTFIRLYMMVYFKVNHRNFYMLNLRIQFK